MINQLMGPILLLLLLFSPYSCNIFGQAYECKGQSDQARAAYERFLQVWTDADADIPEIIAAGRFINQS